MKTRIGDMEVSYTSRGTCTYRLEMWHDGLKKHRVIRGNDAAIVERKARLQVQEWDERSAIAQDREALRRERTQKTELAAQHTAEAQAALAALETILAHTLRVDDTIDWERLKDRSEFPEPAPKLAPATEPPPTEPDRAQYKPVLTFLDRLLSSRREKKIADAARRYESSRVAWQKHVDRRAEDQRNREERLAASIVEWERRRDAFLSAQAESNAAVDNKRLAYESRDADAILDYCDLVLSNSEPTLFTV